MAKAKTHSELFVGLVIIAVIGAVFLSQVTKESEIITGSAVYPAYAAVGSGIAADTMQGTLNVGGYGICETYSWGVQTKTTDGKSLGAKFNVCSNSKYGFNYQCARSTRSYIYPKEIGLVCNPNNICNIVAGKATCLKP